MVDQATTGANIHEAANIKTSLMLARGLIMKEGPGVTTPEQLRRHLEGAVRRAKVLWLIWYETVGKKKQEAQYDQYHYGR